jgi:hypothetical protein
MLWNMGLQHLILKLLINVKRYPIKCFYLIDALRNFVLYTIVKHEPDGSENENRNCMKISARRVSKNIEDTIPDACTSYPIRFRILNH